ncbi:hypothetical protein ABZ845_15470 [Streptomyces sp. NPDC047022]|uniref:hypothetical protein n=1 Tax=Streptomyces sp. NPDC047022 TaxID=3155737 RepID=UPI0033D5C237
MNTARIALAAAAASLTLTAAQAASAAPGEHHPVPVAGPAAATVALTNSDAGKAVVTKVGDSVKVHLTGQRGDGIKWVWSVPASSAPDVLSKVSGASSPNGDSDALFKVVHVGHASLTANRRCVTTAPGHHCPLLVQQWRVAELSR